MHSGDVFRAITYTLHTSLTLTNFIKLLEYDPKHHNCSYYELCKTLILETHIATFKMCDYARKVSNDLHK